MADNEMVMNESEEIQEEGAPRKKGGKLKLIMIIALVVLVGGGAGAKAPRCS
jgi:flagellar basal body-associated protein FliL